jgi:transposase
VTDHDSGKIVWAHEGKSAATLDLFFTELGSERCAQLSAVTLDMSQAYIKSVQAHAPQAALVFDRFHVQRLAHDALDQVRRQLVAEQAGTEQARTIKKSRFVLQKNPENLSSAERTKLAEVQALNRPLFRAYLLKETLVDALDRRQVNVAHGELQAWLGWAARSRLAPFVKAAATIRRHLHGVLAYVRTGLSNGRVEGLNGKIRVITRRAYGFHSARNLIGLIFLCCSLPALSPLRVRPRSHPLML